MRILVIGKNGFISKCFQSYMQRYPKFIVDSVSARDNQWKKYDFRGYDAVYNTTGLAHDNARKGTREQFMALNAKLPYELAVKAKESGVKIFINMSSLIIYGEMSKLGSYNLITHQTKPIPAGIYGESKLAGEDAIKSLEDDKFKIAIIRSPLVYNENAVDNFLKLKKFALSFPVFPDIENARSMIYSDNLCELVKLIVENNKGGYYFPQQEVHICTSKLVKDIAETRGKKIWLTKLFNPIIYYLSKKIIFVRKVFGSLAVDLSESNHFDRKYIVVNYHESIKIITKV